MNTPPICPPSPPTPPPAPLFSAARLEPAAARQAWPLLSLSEPRLDQRKWRDFVRQRSRGGGVMAIRDPRGAIHAVFTWSVRPDLHGESTLFIGDVVVGYLPGRALSDAVIHEVRSLAIEHHCRAIEIELSGALARMLREQLAGRGFRRFGGLRLRARVT